MIWRLVIITTVTLVPLVTHTGWCAYFLLEFKCSLDKHVFCTSCFICFFHFQPKTSVMGKSH